MDSNEHPQTNAILNWVVTLAMIAVAFSGVVLALICIYALPTGIPEPFTGSLFFLGSAAIFVGFLGFQWKMGCTKTESETRRILISESVSDKILKWIVSLFAIWFMLIGVVMGLICIYALPPAHEMLPRPDLGAIYFLGSAVVLTTFIWVIYQSGMLNRARRK